MPQQHELGTYINAVIRFGSRASGVTSFHWVAPVVGRAVPDNRDIRSGDYFQVACQNATDTASGTGARRVTIYGLDLNMQNVHEHIWLNGTNVVTTAFQYTRMNRAHITYVGSNTTNAGSIMLGYGTWTSSMLPEFYLGQINARFGQTTQVHHSIATSTDAHIKAIFVDTGKTGGGQEVVTTARIRVRKHHYSNEVGSGEWHTLGWRTAWVSDMVNDASFVLDSQMTVDGPADIMVEAESTATTARVSATMEMEIHKNVARSTRIDNDD